MEEGSFSVEAAIVMPVVIFVVLSLIFYGFFLRDIVLIETTGRALLTEESVFGSGIRDKLDAAGTGELLSECLWWGTLTKWEYVEDRGCIKYEIIANIFGFIVTTDNVIKSADYFETADRLRFWKSITEEAGELFFEGGSKDGG